MISGFRRLAGHGAIVALVAGGLAGCSSSEHFADGAPAASDAASSASSATPPKPSDTTPPKGSLHKTGRREIPLRTTYADSFTLVPNGLAYVKGEPQVGQSIWIADAESKKSKVIAKDRPGQSVTGSLSASGHWLVWTYQQIQHDPVTPVDWEMSAYNLTTGETKTLASGHSPLPAIATVSGNSAVWSQYLGMKARKSTYWHIDLRTGKKTPVLKKVAAGQAAYSDRTLVYTLAEKVTRGYGKEDLFEIPIEGGEPVRLTHTGRATGPDLFGNTLSWRGRLGKWADTGTRARQLPDGPTVAIPGQSDTAASGDGFVADERNKKWRDFIQVTSLNDPTYPLKIWLPSKKSVCVPCELDAGENTVTWGEQKDDGPITAVLLTLGH